MKKLILYLFALIFILSGCNQLKEKERPNILFIAVDDLRTELGCYGNKQIISPNIDKLAAEGLVFNRAYCQQAICMASRASLMSGIRPNHHQIYNCESLEEDAPGILTLNQQLENNGYQIWASGKIYHHGIDREKQFGTNYKKVKTDQVGRGYLSEEAIQIVSEYNKIFEEQVGGASGGRGPAFESPDVPDNAYSDGLMTDLAINDMVELKKNGQPFFMAIGYHKPHLPFNAPKKYWDLYDQNQIEMADNPFMPEDVSRFFEYNFGELRNYAGIPKGNEILNDTLKRTLKHGYYACVSYIDAQIGRLITGLKENGLDENTIIILWGDHGWKLGEHGMWCKHTQFELDNHVPLIIKVPGQKSAGQKSDALVEFVDIYPSLSELAGLDLPEHLEGTSFVPLIVNPSKKWKEGAFSYWPLGRTNPENLIMGYAVQTDRYRYTEWIKESTGEFLACDLFDHEEDPKENRNISNLTENKELLNKLSELLERGEGWKSVKENLRK